MRTYFIGFLILLVGTLLLVVALGIVPEVEHAVGGLHPDYKTMLKSGNSVAISAPVKWLSYFFGVGIFAIFSVCVYIGAYKKDREKRRKINRFILISSVLYIIVFTLTVFSYWQYHETGTAPYFWAFPAPSAWMMYPLWWIPILFTWMFTIKFDDWIITDDELEEFHRIVEARRAREGR